MVTAYTGMALAIGTVSVIAGGLRGTIAFDRPEISLLAVPLVTMFFLTLGLRAAYTVPSDVDANWVFRLSQPRVMSAVDATAVSMLLLSVVPISSLGALAALLLQWSGHDVAVMMTLDVASGVVLVEWILRDSRTVPFTCARSGDVESLKSRWLAQIIPLLLFAFANAAIQKRVLPSTRAAAWYLGFALAAWSIQRVQRRLASRHATVVFDAIAPDTIATLDLSEAIG
jgi:hypothetical protein